MITGELKNKIDSLWDVFAAGGLVNPLDVIEQITYLMFIHDLDDSDNLRAKEAAMSGSRKHFFEDRHSRESRLCRFFTLKSVVLLGFFVIIDEFFRNVNLTNEIEVDFNMLHGKQIAAVGFPDAFFVLVLAFPLWHITHDALEAVCK